MSKGNGAFEKWCPQEDCFELAATPHSHPEDTALQGQEEMVVDENAALHLSPGKTLALSDDGADRPRMLLLDVARGVWIPVYLTAGEWALAARRDPAAEARQRIILPAGMKLN